MRYSDHSMPKYKPATPWAKFEKKTALLPGVVAERCIEDRGLDRHDPKWDWFVEHVECYVRWLHANKPDWKRKLEGRDPRDFVYGFVNHWLDAYLHDPEKFKREVSGFDLGCGAAAELGAAEGAYRIEYLGNMGSGEAPLGEEGGTFVWRDTAANTLRALHVIHMQSAGADTDNPEETCIIEMLVNINEFLRDKDFLRNLASFASLKLRDVQTHPEYYLASLNAYTDKFDTGHRCFDTFKDAAKFLVSEDVPREELAMYF